MARPPREQVAGGIYHVFARGNDRGLIYRDDDDRENYLHLLGSAARRAEWWLLAYCLMGNHVHLLVETPQPTLARGMQWLHGRYARYFNDRYQRAGHLFQGRYNAVRQLTDEQLWSTVRYVALNPVEARLAASPDDYPWSSHGALAEGNRPHLLNLSRLLWFFGDFGGAAWERYIDWIAEGAISPTGDPSPRK